MRKLKSIFVMILLLGSLLLGTLIGLLITDKLTIKNSDKELETVEVVETIPETFVGTINNNVGVPSEIVDLIVSYNDDYYLSMYTLEQVSTANYFVYDVDGAISDYANKLVVESRKLYDFDFTLTRATYDLTFTDYFCNGDNYYVNFLIDESMNFAFLGDIKSETYDVENSMVIKLVDGEYKIADYDKTQGYYIMFHDNELDSVSDVEDIYAFYFKQLKNTIENENYLKSQINGSEYLASKTYDIAYDRSKAVAYADSYYNSRNNKWYDFSDEGGNCQNYASQCLNAGGMIDDYSGEDWYFDSVDDYSVSWVLVPGFNSYCATNEGSGIVADTNANLYYAEPGDIVQVGISSVTHTTIVSKVVDGHILLNSNSVDMKDWPLEAYTYPTRKFIKILGCNY